MNFSTENSNARASKSKGKLFHKEGRHDNREWFCRSCATSEISPEMPVGWCRLDRKYTYKSGQSGNKSPFVRLGLYCCISCFEAQLTRLARIESKVNPGEVDPHEFDEMWRRR